MKKYTTQLMRLSLVLVLLISGKNSFAQDNVIVASAAKPTVKEEKIITEGDVKEEKAKAEEEEDGKFSVSGYLDTYYFTNFNKPASRDNMGQSGVGRGFDRRVDQFALGMVQTVFKYTNSKSEVVADLAFGPSAQYGNYGNVPVMAPAYGYAIGNDTWSSVMIKQAYFKYNATDKLSFIAGQFGTHIGYEYIDAPLNFFYSINHTFNSGIPFYHTGLKSTYAFSDKVSLMLGVVNGFDYVYDNNRSKGLIGQLSLVPAEGLSVYFNYITSNESNADALGDTPEGNFTVYDLNGGYQASEKLFIGYWFMYGTQKGTLGAPGTFIPADGNVDEKKSWYGANLYLTYAFSDAFSLGFRGEHFDNKDGARGLRNVDSSGQALGASCNTYTLTGSFTLADGHLLLKPELRMDVFNKLSGTGNEQSQQFMDADGLYSKNGQTTLGMAAIYKF
ncbi:MAG: porin [Cyclobacteriaceae bacterium]